MKTDLDHLPRAKQKELASIEEIIFSEFEDAIALGTQEWKRKGRIQALILFGSYARGDWVDERGTMKGYQSDYDLLIIVSHKKLIDMVELWDTLEERFLHEPTIKTPVTFILETRYSVNDALSRGQYFFSDIREQGIALHMSPGFKLAKPKPQTAAQAYEMAKDYFEGRMPSSKNYLKLSKDARKQGMINEAAFLMHQASEHAYSALLLTHTQYDPATHRLTKLRSFAENMDRRLIEAWPRDTKQQRAWFNKLVDAYIKARYSKHYTITEEALTWLSTQVTHLHILIEESCQEHLKKLATAADQEKST